MRTAAVNPFDASPVPVLPPETTPAAIRDALIDEERAEFERVYRQALAEAAETLDLTRVLDVLRNYHRIARLTQRTSQASAVGRRGITHGEIASNPSWLWWWVSRGESHVVPVAVRLTP